MTNANATDVQTPDTTGTGAGQQIPSPLATGAAAPVNTGAAATGVPGQAGVAVVVTPSTTPEADDDIDLMPASGPAPMDQTSSPTNSPTNAGTPTDVDDDDLQPALGQAALPGNAQANPGVAAPVAAAPVATPVTPTVTAPAVVAAAPVAAPTAAATPAAAAPAVVAPVARPVAAPAAAPAVAAAPVAIPAAAVPAAAAPAAATATQPAPTTSLHRDWRMWVIIAVTIVIMAIGFATYFIKNSNSAHGSGSAAQTNLADIENGIKLLNEKLAASRAPVETAGPSIRISNSNGVAMVNSTITGDLNLNISNVSTQQVSSEKAKLGWTEGRQPANIREIYDGFKDTLQVGEDCAYRCPPDHRDWWMSGTATSAYDIRKVRMAYSVENGGTDENPRWVLYEDYNFKEHGHVSLFWVWNNDVKPLELTQRLTREQP